MIAFGWEKGSDVLAKDDIRLAMHLRDIREPEPQLHVNHLMHGTEMMAQLKVIYRGEASFAKLQATRVLGHSESESDSHKKEHKNQFPIL